MRLRAKYKADAAIANREATAMHGTDAWRPGGAFKHSLNGTSYNDFARDELSQVAADLSATPVELIEETLRLCAPRLHEMIELNLVEYGHVVDELWGACVATGYLSERGPDALQSLFATHLPASRVRMLPFLRQRRSKRKRPSRPGRSWRVKLCTACRSDSEAGYRH